MYLTKCFAMSNKDEENSLKNTENHKNISLKKVSLNKAFLI